MEIKVIKEHQKDVYQVEKESIINYINSLSTATIHNFIYGNVILGADWDKTSVIEAINNSDHTMIVVNTANSPFLDHSLRMRIDGQINLFEIGEISLEQLKF